MITDPAIDQYATEHSSAEPPHLAALAARTREELGPWSGMMVGRLEGAFLANIVAITGATRILEIGTFTGYSSLWMASALPDTGRIVTCDVSEKHVAIARDAFASHPDGAKIELRFGPAGDTLATLDGPFDLVFIDADKPGYDAYYEAVLPKLSQRGVILIDNVLWGGEVLADRSDDPDTAALIALNDKIRDDTRVVATMLPIRDGITMVVKA
ncbi:MAG: caffeoyl-CoA O-methyltransferase [Actinomycetota bacterium]|nr:caffeoyl-CoA O-methyltransferase [Actinomycetota bacterium]